MRWCGNEGHFMGKKSGKNAVDAGVFQAFFVVQAVQKFILVMSVFTLHYLGSCEWNRATLALANGITLALENGICADIKPPE